MLQDGGRERRGRRPYSKRDVLEERDGGKGEEEEYE
jgi:hypothetical protein